MLMIQMWVINTSFFSRLLLNQMLHSILLYSNVFYTTQSHSVIIICAVKSNDIIQIDQDPKNTNMDSPELPAI